MGESARKREWVMQYHDGHCWSTMMEKHVRPTDVWTKKSNGKAWVSMRPRSWYDAIRLMRHWAYMNRRMGPIGNLGTFEHLRLFNVNTLEVIPAEALDIEVK